MQYSEQNTIKLKG